MNDKNNGKSEPSRLILPAGVQHPDAKRPEVFGVITPAVGRWVAIVELSSGPVQGPPVRYSVQAWAQIRRGENSNILAEQLTVPQGVQVNLTLACPVLPLEPMVFYGGNVLSLRTVLETTGGKLLSVEREETAGELEALHAEHRQHEVEAP